MYTYSSHALYIVTIFLDSSVELKGFMIQARSSELEEEALGTFLAFADGKQRTMTCQSADVSCGDKHDSVTFLVFRRSTFMPQ